MPEVLMRVDKGKLIDTGRRLWKEASTDDISGLSAEMAYRVLLAAFPFFIFMAALGGFIADPLGFENPTQEIMDELGGSLPEDAHSVIEGELGRVLGSKSPSLLTFGMLGAILGSSAAMTTLIKALNRAYDVEETRPIWKRLPLTLGLTVLTAAFFISSFLMLLIGQIFATEIGELVGLEGASASAFALIRFPIVIALLMFATAFLYWAAPNVKVPFRWASPGAVLFVVVWVLFTVAFAFYVSNLGTYQATYGTLGGVVILLVWLYMTSYLMLLGAELNAVVQSEVAPEKMEGPIAEDHAGEVAEERASAGAGRKPPRDRDERPSASGQRFGWLAILLAAGIGALTALRVSRSTPAKQPEVRQAERAHSPKSGSFSI